MRDELKRAITLFPPKGEVMAYAWSKINVEAGSETMLKTKDGSMFLIYNSKNAIVETEKEYDISEQRPPEAGREINVAITANLEKTADGRVKITGEANLPDGMTLMLSLINRSLDYHAQDKVQVNNGRFTSSLFSNRGAKMIPGAYTIRISTVFPSLEPQHVQKVIGDKGQNLLGPVETSFGNKLVKIAFTKRL